MCVSVGFFLSLHLIGCSSRRLSTLVNLIWSIQICNCCQTGDTRFEVSIFALNKSDEHTRRVKTLHVHFRACFRVPFSTSTRYAYIHSFTSHSNSIGKSLTNRYKNHMVHLKFDLITCKREIQLDYFFVGKKKKTFFFCACNRMSAIELFFFVRNICAFAIRMLHRCCIWI